MNHFNELFIHGWLLAFWVVLSETDNTKHLPYLAAENRHTHTHTHTHILNDQKQLFNQRDLVFSYTFVYIFGTFLGRETH